VSPLVRNIAIIAVIALAVVAVPGGGNAADTIIATISLAFMAAIAFLGYRLYRENQFTLSSLSDRHRGLLYGAIGLIFATLVATDRLWDTGLGLLTWFALLGAASFALFYVWSESRRYG
jgi:TRAP-type C4-dicarboxylate transport system permease small subunit